MEFGGKEKQISVYSESDKTGQTFAVISAQLPEITLVANEVAFESILPSLCESLNDVVM